MKKYIIIVIACVLVISSIVSCTEPNDSPSDGTAISSDNTDITTDFNETTISSDNTTITTDAIPETEEPDESTENTTGTEENADPEDEYVKLYEHVDERLKQPGEYNCRIHNEAYHNIYDEIGEYVGRDKFSEIYNSYRLYPSEEEKDTSCITSIVSVINVLRIMEVPFEEFEKWYYTKHYEDDIDLEFLFNATDAELEEWGRLPMYIACPEFLARDMEIGFKYDLQFLCSTSEDERFKSVYDKYCSYNDRTGKHQTKLSPWEFSYAEYVKDTGITKEELQKLWDDYVGSLGWGLPHYYEMDFDKLYENLDYYASLVGTEGYEYPVLVDELIKGEIKSIYDTNE